VVDRADLLPPAAEAHIAAQSSALEQATGHQLVVVTVTGLGGHAIEDYGLKLGNYWGVGGKGANDGILLIVAPKERKVRIEVGKGLELTLRDEDAAAILRDDVLPAFRHGDMACGIQAGVDDVIRELTPPMRKAA
jgi:uncharacterized protein